MPSSWTDLEYGDVAQALLWSRSRTFRPFGLLAPFAQLLDGRLADLSDANKALALALAREILSRRQEARDETFDGLPDVTQAGEIKKDAEFGYKVRSRVLDDMRLELAQLVDYWVNPAASSSQGNPPVCG